ncbi:hypothetical protein RTP6_005729 [Batrachochytrium dendrobatidis]
MHKFVHSIHTSNRAAARLNTIFISRHSFLKYFSTDITQPATIVDTIPATLITTKKPAIQIVNPYVNPDTGSPLKTDEMPIQFRHLIASISKNKMEDALVQFAAIEQSDPLMLHALTVSGFNALIRAVSDPTRRFFKNYTYEQRVVHSRKILDSLESSGKKPNIKTFEHLISLYTKTEDIESIKHLLSWMKARIINAKNSKPMLQCLIHANTGAGNLRHAMEYFHKLRQLELNSVDPFNVLMRSQAHYNQEDNLKQTYALIQDSGCTPTVSTFEIMSSFYFAKRDYPTVLKYIDLCKQQCKPATGHAPGKLSVSMYYMLAFILNNQGAFKEAHKAITDMKSFDMKLTKQLMVENIFAQAFQCPSGHVDGTKRIWMEYVKLPDILQSHGRILKAMAHLFGPMSSPEDLATLEKLCMESGIGYSTMLTCLVSGYTSIDDMNTARTILSHLESLEKPASPQLHSRVVQAYARIGNISEAISYIQTLNKMDIAVHPTTLYYALGKALRVQPDLAGQLETMILEMIPEMTKEHMYKRAGWSDKKNTSEVEETLE